ncbi:putative ribonuclease H-like domain-containing protein [Tanacetum coccineum]
MLFIKLILHGLNDSQHLPSEWNTHVVVWRNKLDLDTMSFDDLYNNFKIIEQEVKGIASSSSSSQNMAFVSSPSSTNEVNTAYGVSTTNTQVIPASTQLNKSEFNLATYKRGLASVEEQLVFYKKNKVIFCEKLDVLKRDISYKDSDISMLKRLFSPPNLDLSYSSLEEFQQPDFEGYGPKPSKSVSEDTSNEVRESPDAPLIEELVSDEKKTVFPTVAKIEFVRSKQQEKPLGNHYHQRERVVSGNNYTRVNYNYFAKKVHPSAHMNMVPRAVLMKTGLRPLNTARPVTTAHPKTTVYSARPMQKVVNTARPNSAVVNGVRENQVNAVKASACWVWRPTKLNSASITLKKHNYVDAGGRSKHMTCNMSYLSDFKEFDGGYVTFGGGAKGGKIIGKGTLKTSKLDFEAVYFVKESQFNLFSVLQMCDKKNIVLFTDTGCFVLSPDFKLADESQALKKEFSVARTPQQNGVGEIRNRTLIEATRTMLADSKLPTTFWAEAVNTACYVQNKVLVVKPQSKTPYELFRGDGPKLLFDIDVLTKSMNYVPVVAGTNSNDIVDGLLFDSSLKNASNDEPQPSSDDECVNKESGIDDQKRPENSTQDVNTVGLSINIASTNVNTGSLNINIVSPTVTTAPLEAIHANFFSYETEIDMSNITTTYLVPSTPNIRIHKDHSLDHVIGDVQSGEEPKKVIQALKDPSWIEAMQEELCSSSYKMFGPCGIYHNGEKSHRLVVQGYTQEEGIDYDEVFGPVARIEAIRLFLAYESFKDFIVYQMDVKSAFLYDKIEEEMDVKNAFMYEKIKEEVYVCQPPGFEDLDFPDRVYKVEKALYDLHQAPRACYVKTASTPMETYKPLLKDADGKDVDEHLYRYMIGSLMYLTSSRPDIMFADSPFDLVAYNNSDYAGASLDRKSTIGGCQFLGCRLISWQCKKQTMVANSTTEAKYIAASNYYGHVL